MTFISGGFILNHSKSITMRLVWNSIGINIYEKIIFPKLSTYLGSNLKRFKPEESLGKFKKKSIKKSQSMKCILFKI